MALEGHDVMMTAAQFNVWTKLTMSKHFKEYILYESATQQINMPVRDYLYGE